MLKPHEIQRFHVFLASPGDVSGEREYVRNFFDRYNKNTAPIWNIEFEVVDCDNYATLGVGRPQALITAATLEKYRESTALVIGIMGQRFGSPTGNSESGTEEEFLWAMENHKQFGFPEIKWFFKKLDHLTMPTDPKLIPEAATQWEKVLAFRNRMKALSDPVFFTEYSNLDDFRAQLDRDLSRWLSDDSRPWASQRTQSDLQLGALTPPPRSPAPSTRFSPPSEMELLVEKLDICQKIDEQLYLCDYHCDRFEVRLFEQRNRDGEVDLAGDRVLLKPTVQMLNLFTRMHRKVEPAGHWGLMKTHRDWLVRHILSKATDISNKEEGRIRIFQAGIASHNHYFGNIKLIREALHSHFGATQRPLDALVQTVDICIGPIEAIRDLIALSESNSKDAYEELPREFYCAGHDVRLTSELVETIQTCSVGPPEITHRLDVRDLTETNALGFLETTFHLIISHQLFTFWTIEEERKLRRFCRNILTVSSDSTDILLGFTPGAGSSRLRLDEYEVIFREEGLVMQDILPTWDIYDLSQVTRAAFLRNNDPITVAKKFKLVHLRPQ